MNYYISDLHLNCKNKYENRTLEHDKILKENWNKTVTNADTVYILGDIGKEGGNKEIEYLCEIISTLKGKKVLIQGNHKKLKDFRLRQLFINSMIDDINSERETDIQHLGADELEALSDKYQQLQDTEFADVRDELGTDDRDFTKYGVHGYAKPMEDASGDIICEGGADQFNTALPEYMLKRIGVEY